MSGKEGKNKKKRGICFLIIGFLILIWGLVNDGWPKFAEYGSTARIFIMVMISIVFLLFGVKNLFESKEEKM
jgi:uncharacterized ion transporter superfamily protein YfcC